MDDGPLLVAQAGHELGRHFALVDHRAVDTMDLLELVAVGHLGQYGAPYHGGHAESAVDAHGAHSYGGAKVRHAGDDGLVRRDLGRDLNADVRPAFVVLHHQFIRVLGLRVHIAQAHGQVGGIASAQPDRRYATGQRTDKGNLDDILGLRRCCRQDHTGRCGCHGGGYCSVFLAHSLSPWVAWTNWTNHWRGVTDPNRCGAPADAPGKLLERCLHQIQVT
ncbi:hypothetical protein D9M68_276990 [compost metagenome]